MLDAGKGQPSLMVRIITLRDKEIHAPAHCTVTAPIPRPLGIKVLFYAKIPLLVGKPEFPQMLSS